MGLIPLNEELIVKHGVSHICQPVMEYDEFIKIYKTAVNNGWVVHTPTEIDYMCSLLYKHYLNKSKVLIVDDIDFDGVGSATVSLEYLKTMFVVVDVYSTIEHGINEKIVRKSEDYDLLIIVDGGTNQEKELMDLKCDVLILDHHTPDILLEHHIICHKYSDRHKKYKTLINCNSKYTSYLSAISAGMLCYIVFHTFYHRLREGTYDIELEEMEPNKQRTFINSQNKKLKDNLNLIEIGAVTLISDIVPIDEYVLLTLVHYFERHTGTSAFIREILQLSSLHVTLKNLQWEVFPLINYTKRLKDSDTISMLYKYGVTHTSGFLNENRTTGRTIVDAIGLYGEKTVYNNFIFIDATMLYEIYNFDISNFKGLMCNRVSTNTNMPTIVGINKQVCNNTVTEISVRSQGYNSFDYFMRQDILDGGGHSPACGFKINSSVLPEILCGYDEYLKESIKETENIIVVNDSNELWKMDLKGIAIFNYFAISNIRALQILVNNFDHGELYMTTQTKGTLCGIEVEVRSPIGNAPVLLKPVLTNYNTKCFSLDLSTQKNIGGH